MSFLNRSTRSIVAGRRPKTPPASTSTDELLPPREQADNAPEESAPSPSEGIRVKFRSLPQWTLWAIGIVVLLSLTAAALLNRVPSESQTPLIAAGRSIIAVSADPALAGQALPGDVVRLYDKDGEIIEQLQYVQVYDTTESGQLLLLVDDDQAGVMLRQTISKKVVLVVHDDPIRASALLDLQARIIHPTIILDLQSAVSLSPGDMLELEYQATINPIEATLPEIHWTTSDDTVVTVEDGIITAHGVGQATVTGMCAGLEASCVVTVAVPLNAVTLDKTDAVAAVGETLSLTAAPDPADATGFTVVWSTADPAVATVAEDGTVTGVAAGSTTITASCGELSASCTVTVGVHAEIVQLDYTELELSVGQTAALTGTVYPSSGVIDIPAYTSSDPAVAAVAEDGTVTGIAPGTATITVHYGETAASCVVTIIDTVTQDP